MPDSPVSPRPDRACAERDALVQALFESERQCGALTVLRQHLADELATIEARVRAAAARDVDAALRERDSARAERDAAVQARDRADAARASGESALRLVTSSTSWRITAPVRLALMALLGRGRPRS